MKILKREDSLGDIDPLRAEVISKWQLPNASFIGFTGTPLFKYDHLTKRIFGGYISRYDFKRSEEDNSTVKLVYENRGEKLGLARLDLNDRIAPLAL